MLRFEAALAAAEARHGVIPAEAAAAIADALAGFRPDLAALARGTARDGVVVPELVRQLRAAVGEPHGGAGAFRRDQPGRDRHGAGAAAEGGAAGPRRRGWRRSSRRSTSSTRGSADRPLMGRTRMQAAIPITVGARIASWRGPLVRQAARLDALLPEVLVVQFGGAAGTLDKLGDKAAAVRAALAEALGLGDAPQWQSQRDRIVELGGWLATTTGALGKLGQDVALMAQAGGEIVLAGGGGSSAMPHKANPVGAEVLVALARFNAVQAGGLQQAMVHEQERSGAAWTLEWLLLPPMLIATAAALRTALQVAASIEAIGG